MDFLINFKKIQYLVKMFSKRKTVSSKVCIGPARASVKLNMNSYVFWFPGMALGPVRPSPALPGLWVDGGTELEGTIASFTHPYSASSGVRAVSRFL